VAEQLPLLDRSSLSDRALAALAGAIQRGEFRDGRLPNEPELARQLGVSRATVRSALTSLEQLGLVRRRRGSGTWLRPHVTANVLALHGLIPWAVVLGASHRVTSTATLRPASYARTSRPRSTTPEWAGDVHRVDRMLAADGRPAVLINELIPDAALAAPLTEDDLADSVLTLSRRYFRVPIDHAVADLVPTIADHHHGASLGVPPGAPYLVLEEIFHSEADERLATAVVSLNPAFIRLGVFRRVLD
jgi:GntR family transcriptional regulator